MNKKLLAFTLIFIPLLTFSQAPKFTIDGDSIVASGDGPFLWYTAIENDCSELTSEGTCNAPQTGCVWLIQICVPNTVEVEDGACAIPTTQQTCEQLSSVGCNWTGSSCKNESLYEHDSLGYLEKHHSISSGNKFMVMDNSQNWTVFTVNELDSITRSSITETACNEYIVPSGDETYNATGIYNDTIPNLAGCDSIITIDLTIDNIVVDASTSINGNQINANSTTGNYQWLDCDNSNAAIQSETNQGFAPSSNGNYAVEVTENSCVDTSSCVNVTLSSTKSPLSKDDIKVYPNPVQDVLTIDLGGEYTPSAIITIIDNAGKAVKLVNVDNLRIMQIDTSELTSGRYLVKVEHNEQLIKVISIQKM